MDIAEISKKIKAYREQEGLSQEAMAQKVGVSLFTLQRWEQRKTKRISYLAQQRLKILGVVESNRPNKQGGIK